MALAFGFHSNSFVVDVEPGTVQIKVKNGAPHPSGTREFQFTSYGFVMFHKNFDVVFDIFTFVRWPSWDVKMTSN